jgi:uncharacterized integral membrane protein (TIGR00698 family)
MLSIINKEKNAVYIWAGLGLSVFIGVAGYGIKILINSPIADPLLVALLLGILCRSIIDKHKDIKPGLAFAPSVFLPIGIIFYAASNLNFAKLGEIDRGIILLLIGIIFVYFFVILFVGKLLNQKRNITFLVASGSAICGASAIAITSPAVEAEPDDISISLLSVSLVAFVGLSIIIPFIAALFNITCKIHCLMSGSVLQFTGLVKVANSFIPFLKKDMSTSEALSLALSVKSIRYLGLLIAIPLFASLIKGKLYIPWFLWTFLAAGLLGTWIYVSYETVYNAFFTTYIKSVHDISWSIAMAAIGLNADVKNLLSNNGAKAVIMAFAGFIAAIVSFLIGLYIFKI